MKSLKKKLHSVACFFGFHGDPVGAVDIVRYNLGKHLRYDAYLKCRHCGERMDESALPENERALLVNPEGVVSADYCTVECARRWCRGRPGWSWIPFKGERNENGHAKAG